MRLADCKEATAPRFASKCRERSAKARAGVEVTGFPNRCEAAIEGGHGESLATCFETRHAKGWQSVARQPAKRGAVACGASRGRTHKQNEVLRCSEAPRRGKREGKN